MLQGHGDHAWRRGELAVLRSRFRHVRHGEGAALGCGANGAVGSSKSTDMWKAMEAAMLVGFGPI
jgi:hypothetical protein